MTQPTLRTVPMSPVAKAVRAAMLACGLLVLAAPAMAQDAEAGEKDKQQPQELEGVVVTAQKRVQSKQDVPMSISVVESSVMLKTGESRLVDYYARVPGLSINDRGARATLVIRGVSAGSSMNPTVGIMIDGVPFGSSTTSFSIPDLDPFDINRIEVLRGPQGTLYGASSMGGLVKYVMTDPNTHYASGRYQVGMSSTHEGGMGYVTRAATNLPVIRDRLAFRASAFVRHDPGYVDDPLRQTSNVNDADVVGGRVAALWNINKDFTLEASVLAQNDSMHGTARVDMEQASYRPVTGPYQHERLPGTGMADVRTRMSILRIDGDLGWASLHSISSYSEFSLVGPQDVTGTFGRFTGPVYGMPNLGVKIINNSWTDKYTQEFRLASPEDGRALGWIAGVFYTNEDTLGVQKIVAVDKGTGADLGLGTMYGGRSPSTYEEVAAFGNVDYHFTKAFDIQLGGRFSSIKQDFANHYFGPLNGGTSSDYENASFKVWTYNVSPRYRFNASHMGYARVATGYRAGGVNALLLKDKGEFPTQFEPDSLTSYELGLKGNFGDRLVYDLALFYIDWKDIQLAEVSQYSGNTYFVNAGGARSKGVEASMQWRPLSGLVVSGNVAWTDAKLTEPTPNGTYGQPGDRLPFSAEWTSSLGAGYSFPLSSGWNANFGGRVTYVGDRMSSFTSSAQAERFRLRSYSTAKIYAGIQSLHWSINAYINNLTDTRGYLSATAQNATTGVSTYGLLLIQPRTIGASVTWIF